DPDRSQPSWLQGVVLEVDPHRRDARRAARTRFLGLLRVLAGDAPRSSRAHLRPHAVLGPDLVLVLALAVAAERISSRSGGAGVAAHPARDALGSRGREPDRGLAFRP